VVTIPKPHDTPGGGVVMKIGVRIRMSRHNRNLTLSDLSDMTGISVSFLSDIERGISYPSLATCQKIARAFGVTLSGLFLFVRIDIGSGD
jgi:transcriptional regulator with XRE-family HTH domain